MGPYYAYVTPEWYRPDGEVDFVEDVEIEVEILSASPYVPASWHAPAEGGIEEVEFRLDGQVITQAQFERLGGDYTKVLRDLSEGE